MTRKKQRFEILVGLFALACLSVIIWMSLKLDRNAHIGRKNKTYYADFDSVSGLVPKIPVEVSGITSGFVDTIELVDNKARLKVVMEDGVKVFENALLLIKDRGVLGDRYVVLKPGSQDLPLIPHEGFIKNTQSMSDFEKLTTNLSDTASILKELVQSDNPQGALGQTIVNLRNVTKRIDDMVADNRTDVDRIMDNVDSLTYQMDQIAQENRDNIHDTIFTLKEISGSLNVLTQDGGSISEAAFELNDTLASVNRIVKKLEDGKGTVGRLLNDEETIDKVNETLDGLNNSLGLFQRVQLKFRYRAEFVTNALELQNQFGIFAYVAPDKYFLVELVDSAVGETNVINTIIESQGVSTSTRSIQTDSALTITFMMAKRIRDASLRVGLIRSHGGVGLDWYFFKDQMVLTGEVFHLGRPNDNPLVRIYGSALLFNHFILTAGVEDLISANGRRSPFIGLGLSFTDNDFKALLPVLGRGL